VVKSLINGYALSSEVEAARNVSQALKRHVDHRSKEGKLRRHEVKEEERPRFERDKMPIRV